MSTETIDLVSKDLWERAKVVYISALPSQEERDQLERYFSMISSVTTEDNVFCFHTTNAFAADFLKNKYASKIKGCLTLVGANPNLTLDFKVDETRKPAIIIPPTQSAHVQQATSPSSYADDPVQSHHTPFISTMPLREEYNFEEFVAGPSNSWAYSAAKGVVSHPGESGYNPLFIHGGTGLGKTHLMQAIGNELRKNNPSMAICYLTAETFLNEYVNYLQNGKINSFRDKYRNIDVLLLDDVQFFQKGKVVQEEFFNTFNYLQGKNKQIVMTSDVSPKNLPALEERLISRFVGGMVQEIESPSYETRLAILQKKAEGSTPQIPVSILKFIAENIKSHVRAMEGALAKVKVILSNSPTAELPPFLLSKLLKDFIDKEQSLRKLTVEEIQAAVAKKYGVTIHAILSAERTASIVTPRQLAMYISRKFTTKSLPEIATLFDKKHATILHGVKTIQKRLDVESDLKQTLDDILSEFGYTSSDGKDLSL